MIKDLRFKNEWNSKTFLHNNPLYINNRIDVLEEIVLKCLNKKEARLKELSEPKKLIKNS